MKYSIFGLKSYLQTKYNEKSVQIYELMIQIVDSAENDNAEAIHKIEHKVK